MVEWFRDASNIEEHERFLDAIAYALDENHNITLREQLKSAVEAYVVDQEKGRSCSQQQIKALLKKLLPNKLKEMLRRNMFQRCALVAAAKDLANQNVLVDIAAIEDISLLVEKSYRVNGHKAN